MVGMFALSRDCLLDLHIGEFSVEGLVMCWGQVSVGMESVVVFGKSWCC
jgi:hypothetical protein